MINRRELMGYAAALAAVPNVMMRSEVISFHLDQPYLDSSGTAAPYIPPRGARSAQKLAELSDEAFSALYFCV